jgi:hypothetical protein
MIKAAVLMIAAALSIFLLAKAFEKKGAPKSEAANQSASVEEVAKSGPGQPMEITAGKKLGEAGGLVRSFFKHWEFARFEDMHAQTAYSRKLPFFIESMKRSPIHWRRLEIISEKRNGEYWDVELAVDVTDVTSALAGIVVNTYAPPGNDSDDIYRFNPQDLGIERFMRMKQIWKVADLGEKKLLIDLGAGDSKIDRHSNIMNYVLDAGQVEAPPRGEDGWDDDTRARVATRWLAETLINLNKTKTDDGYAENVLKEARPLIDKGLTKLVEFAKARRHERTFFKTADSPTPVQAF